MKAYLLVVALAVLPACGKKNDVAVLEHEAVSLAKYYQPKLDALDARMQTIFESGKKIPGTAPGVQDVGMRLQEAKLTLDKLHGIVDPGDDKKPGAEQKPGDDKKSALETQAETLAKAGQVADLEKLVHDTETALNAGIIIVNDSLDTVEGWLAQYAAKTLAIAPAPAAPKAEEAPPEPAQPEGVNTPQPVPPAPAPQQPAPKK